MKSLRNSYSKKQSNDKHNLYDRFVRSQIGCFPEALREIKQGSKSSCWMWFIFPTPPWIVNGLERGSFTNQEYSLRTDKQAEAYLEFEADGVNLRKNYIEITIAARDHLKNGRTSRQLFGGVDSPKFLSSITYFEKISKQIEDTELNELCAEVVLLLKAEEETRKEKEKAKETKIAEEILLMKRKREEDKLIIEKQKEEKNEESLSKRKKEEENKEENKDENKEENKEETNEEKENKVENKEENKEESLDDTEEVEVDMEVDEKKFTSSL